MRMKIVIVIILGILSLGAGAQRWVDKEKRDRAPKVETIIKTRVLRKYMGQGVYKTEKVTIIKRRKKNDSKFRKLPDK